MTTAATTVRCSATMRSRAGVRASAAIASAGSRVSAARRRIRARRRRIAAIVRRRGPLRRGIGTIAPGGSSTIGVRAGACPRRSIRAVRARGHGFAGTSVFAAKTLWRAATIRRVALSRPRAGCISRAQTAAVRRMDRHVRRSSGWSSTRHYGAVLHGRWRSSDVPARVCSAKRTLVRRRKTHPVGYLSAS